VEGSSPARDGCRCEQGGGCTGSSPTAGTAVARQVQRVGGRSSGTGRPGEGAEGRWPGNDDGLSAGAEARQRVRTEAPGERAGGECLWRGRLPNLNETGGVSQGCATTWG
jgi:hypothetical protein